MVSHGSGLAIDQYYPLWSLFTEDCDLVVYDLRNHGWNPLSDLLGHDLPALISDQQLIHQTIHSHFGAKPTIGVFHSLSALTALLSPTRGAEFVARVLFDPPLCTPGRRSREFEAAARRAAEMTRRRAYRFRTREDYVKLLRGMPNLDRLTPAALELMARTTLRECPGKQQGYELCCPPEYEARIAEEAIAYSQFSNFGAMGCPTRVVGADASLPSPYVPALDASRIPGVDYDFLPETTHFLPLEKPEDCAAITYEYIGLHSLP